ncbi:CapA family protein [Candidatus Bipolaricaulota bacterium]|nr:CapA family protein [Candidatus Bipolaricaulota bacterium]
MGSPYGVSDSLRWFAHLARPSWVQQADLEREPLSGSLAPDGRTVRVILFGDLMPFSDDRRLIVAPSIRNLLLQADLVVGNCETPVAPKTKLRPFAFAMGVDQIRAVLEALGVRLTQNRCVLSVANNHAGDQCSEGFEETTRQLASLGVSLAGTQQHGIPIVPTIQVDSVRIAVLAWTDWINRNRFTEAHGICRREQLERQIVAAKQANADVLLGCPHWDFEFCLFPSPQTVRFARQALSQGVTALVGHHPHVLQPIVNHPEGLCVYSLGNTTPLPTRLVRWPTMVGAMLCLDIVAKGDNLGAIASYHVLPIRIRRNRRQILLSAIAIDDPTSPSEQLLLDRLFPPRLPGKPCD